MPRYIGCDGLLGLNDAALIVNDLAAQPLGSALQLFGVNRYAGELVEQLTAFGEADQRRPVPTHLNSEKNRPPLS